MNKTLAGLVFVESARYLFGGVWRLGEDGLPVRPNKHYEREVEEDQVDNWNKNWTICQIIYTEPMMDNVSAQIHVRSEFYNFIVQLDC